MRRTAVCVALAGLAFSACQRSPEARPHLESRAVPSSSAPTFSLVPRGSFCVTDGKVDTAPTLFRVDSSGMRAIIAGDDDTTAELEFAYEGPSHEAVPLADGELRRQIGLKLRAVDVCNLVYVMWHVEPTSGIYVQVKSNPGQSTHAACGDRGYAMVSPTESAPVALLRRGEKHSLRATINGATLIVEADGQVAWKGALPSIASTLRGPVGMRTDNAIFDFDYRIRAGTRVAKCTGRE